MARMVRAGKFDKVITLQRIAPAKPDNQGKIIRNGSTMKQNWQDVITLRASIEPISGREYFSGAFQIGENITRIRVRYRPDLVIDRKMRIKYGERIFSIFDVIDFHERHEELQLMCKEGEAHNG
ncbi:phage head closure protein [Mannheimia indoligenes]|uniref:phage head closure protein n=1 Tax=Mannheimia indoligenes TaxID=3103145 RepID=UPI002FE69A02